MHVSPEVLHKSPQLLRLVAAGPYAAPVGRHFLPHKHPVWELVYYRSGHIQCPVGSEVYESQPGMFLLTPPETIHAEYAWTAYSNYYIQIDAPAASPWPRVIQDDADQSFGRLCAAIVREQSAAGSGRDTMLAALLTQLDILLRRSQEQRQLPPAESLVRRVEQILEERYNSGITIASIAQEVNVSPSHLRAQFVRLRGCTPMDYLQSVRVRHAVAMLQSSALTLEIIAGFCGYDSASHLSRHVKRVTGKTPGSLRG
jgi:AraC-like DNA-binding protein